MTLSSSMDFARRLGFEEAVELVEISLKYAEPAENIMPVLRERLEELKARERANE